MSAVKKFLKFCNDNAPLIGGGVLIVAFHWTWWRLQNVPQFVSPEEKKDMPFVILGKYLYNRVRGEPETLPSPSTPGK